MARSSDMVKRQGCAAEEVTSVSEGTTCLLVVMPVTSGTGASLLPAVEEQDELAQEASPRGLYFQLRPSVELSFP